MRCCFGPSVENFDDIDVTLYFYRNFRPYTLEAAPGDSRVNAIQTIRNHLRDIDPEFLQSSAVGIVWEYQRLFEELAQDGSLTADFKREEFIRRRGSCAVRALCVAAKSHGVPYDFITLPSNGQQKLVVKTGRVLIIQEAIGTLSDELRSSGYKRQLADAHGVVRQLELDLGDVPGRILDWGGSTLAVFLHGAYGVDFNGGELDFGYLMLGVPDAAYTHWVMRLDLHEVAMYGLSWPDVDVGEAQGGPDSQPDKVIVTLKSQKTKKSGQ